jgi:superfamily II DNA/RNA helicase
VIVVAHTRELANQIYEVYAKLIKYAPDYKLVNLV